MLPVVKIEVIKACGPPHKARRRDQSSVHVDIPWLSDLSQKMASGSGKMPAVGKEPAAGWVTRSAECRMGKKLSRNEKATAEMGPIGPRFGRADLLRMHVLRLCTLATTAGIAEDFAIRVRICELMATKNPIFVRIARP